MTCFNHWTILIKLWHNVTLKKKQFYICCTLRSWVHLISMLFRTFYPRLEDIDTFQCNSDSFPHWPHISGFVQNCQNYISMYHCSPIAGRRSWKSVSNLSHNYAPIQDLHLSIGEQWYIKMYFWQFSTHPEICGQCGKLSELHWNESMSSNRGEKALNSIEIGWTQDLRMQHISYKLLSERFKLFQNIYYSGGRCLPGSLSHNVPGEDRKRKDTSFNFPL